MDKVTSTGAEPRAPPVEQHGDGESGEESDSDCSEVVLMFECADEQGNLTGKCIEMSQLRFHLRLDTDYP